METVCIPHAQNAGTFLLYATSCRDFLKHAHEAGTFLIKDGDIYSEYLALEICQNSLKYQFLTY